jgi:transcriptional regulator with XRE-family HTH domain
MGRIVRPSLKSNQRQGNRLAQHIGSQLLKARQKRLWSMREVSQASGLSNPFICQIENAQSMPGAEALWKLSQAFDLPISYWFRGFDGRLK